MCHLLRCLIFMEATWGCHLSGEYVDTRSSQPLSRRPVTHGVMLCLSFQRSRWPNDALHHDPSHCSTPPSQPLLHTNHCSTPPSQPLLHTTIPTTVMVVRFCSIHDVGQPCFIVVLADKGLAPQTCKGCHWVSPIQEISPHYPC